MWNKIGLLLCWLGVHRPLRGHTQSFVDCVSGNDVYDAECSCGRTWMVDSQFGFFGSKVKHRGKCKSVNKCEKK